MSNIATVIATLSLPLDQIEANEVALRAVDLEDVEVQKMFDSIKARGVLTPIRVKPSMLADKKSPKTLPDGRPMYTVVDGLHRFTGAVKARLETITAVVVSVEDAQVEEEQLVANLHRIPTKAYEYGKHLKKILGRDLTQTKFELANRLNVSEGFIDARLNLGGLHKDGVDSNGEPTSSIGRQVDAGRITLANAVELARLKPSDEQVNYVKDAIEMPALQFAKLIKDKIKAIKDEKRAAGTATGPRGFEASASLRKRADVEAEAKSLSTLTVLAKSKGISSVEDAMKFALEWALQLDEQSVNKARNEYEAGERRRAAEKAAAAAERAEKAKKDAEKAAAEVHAAQ